MILTSKCHSLHKLSNTKKLSYAFAGKVVLTSKHCFLEMFQPSNIEKFFECFCRQGASQLPDGGLAQLCSGHFIALISLPSIFPFFTFHSFPSSPLLFHSFISLISLPSLPFSYFFIALISLPYHIDLLLPAFI